jgi:hypothetical protein
VSTWTWSLLAGVLGIAAGLQAIYEKHPKEFIDGSVTFPGVLYLLSRGALPGIAFVLLYPRGYLGSIDWVAALVCGVSSEALLRSQFFIKRTGTGEEVLAGPLDLLKSWQAIMLQYVGPHVARKKKHFIDTYLPKQPFLDLCKIAKQNLGLFDENRTKQIRDEVDGLLAKHHAETTPSDAEYRLQLGFLLYRYLERAEFKVVVQK